MGTDGLDGTHGRNADEVIARVREGGQKPADAIISATSLDAKSLNLEEILARWRKEWRPTGSRSTAIRPKI